ncbi:MAG TPA: N-acetylneuraminate synthase [Coriobacteriia bacterium]|nr:N-acetylneuraminate synthase [Coriobacteriia bacterium]
MMSRVRVIAEAGVNHNGSPDRALAMVDAAADAGADAIKFQSFVPEALVSPAAQKADYQKTQTGDGSQLEMLRALQLDAPSHERLLAACADRGIAFLSSPFDIPSVRLLASLGAREFKIASGEITNLPMLREIAACAESVLLSTGMATLDEIAAAIEALEAAGLERSRITVLHCTTEYPTPFDEVNLLAMAEIRDRFGIEIGYSDHTRGIEVSVAAAALGATVVEKHFTLDRSLPGPDHAASVEPDELASLVTAVRNVSVALGDGHKVPTPTESRNMPLVRKSIVAAAGIAKGETFTEANLTTKRPGTGLSPMLWDSVIGQQAPRAFAPDEMIEL